MVAVVLSKELRPQTEISFWITVSLSTLEMTSLILQRTKRTLRLQRNEAAIVITEKITRVTRATLVNNQLENFK